MSKQLTFNDLKEKYFPRLEQYTPIVERVHGGSHPEFYEVRKLFDVINEKVRKAGSARPKLDEEFAKLRAITNNYTVPGDVCESYEAVYTMLAEADSAYQG